jgi:hypothetical protein
MLRNTVFLFDSGRGGADSVPGPSNSKPGSADRIANSIDGDTCRTGGVSDTANVNSVNQHHDATNKAIDDVTVYNESLNHDSIDDVAAEHQPHSPGNNGFCFARMRAGAERERYDDNSRRDLEHSAHDFDAATARVYY